MCKVNYNNPGGWWSFAVSTRPRRSNSETKQAVLQAAGCSGGISPVEPRSRQLDACTRTLNLAHDFCEQFFQCLLSRTLFGGPHQSSLHSTEALLNKFKVGLYPHCPCTARSFIAPSSLFPLAMNTAPERPPGSRAARGAERHAATGSIFTCRKGQAGLGIHQMSDSQISPVIE